MKTYRAAIIGLGRMGSTIDDEVVGYPAVALPYSIAASCRAIPNLELVAGADLLAEKRDAFRERWGVDALYEDFREMIRQEEPDLVAICTKAENHAELGCAVAELGAPMMFLEKAMACSMLEADALRDAVKKAGCAFNTGVLRRFDSRYHEARRRIERGEIGEPKVAVHYAASSLLHGHIHSLDTLMYLLGDPQVISIYGELQPRDLDLSANRLDSDPRATYQVEFEHGLEGYSLPVGQWDFEIHGSEGILRGCNNGVDWSIRRPQPVGTKFRTYVEEQLPPPDSRSATQYCLEDLISAHEEGRPTLGHIDIAHHCTEACLAVAESHRIGQRVTLPLDNRDLYVFHV